MALAALLTVVVACQPSNRQLITRDQLGEEWPFVLQSGILFSERNGTLVVFESGGKHYAISRSARDAAARNGYVAVEPILKPLPQETVRVRVDRVQEPVRRDVFREAARCDGAGRLAPSNAGPTFLQPQGLRR